MQPWGLQHTRMIHLISTESYAQGEKKCMYIGYLKQSKGYIFIGENKDGHVKELESR